MCNILSKENGKKCCIIRHGAEILPYSLSEPGPFNRTNRTDILIELIEPNRTIKVRLSSVIELKYFSKIVSVRLGSMS